jgi:hypothetical protein
MMAPSKRGALEPTTDTEKLIDALRCDASIAATADDARLLHAAADEIERLTGVRQINKLQAEALAEERDMNRKLTAALAECRASQSQREAK